jgi:aminopeptidase YwaD
MIAIPESGVHTHLQVLTHDIGVRLAGSRGEQQAAEYIASTFERCGAAVTIERFPVRERAVASESLELQIGGAWRGVSCSLLSNTPGTGGALLEAPIAVIDAPTGYQRDDLSYLTGKAVVHLGTHIETPDHYRRLMEARPAFLMFVDARYPAGVATADGMFPAYVHAYGAAPTVSVAYLDAWDAYAAGVSAARLCVDGGMRDSTSQNVVGELTGTDASAGVLYVGAHHDTQADSVGADDNGSGVAALLALASALAPMPRRRTIRLISFGTEEQLSVGSATYVREHREELASLGRFMFNFDAFGSLLGWTFLVCNGPAEMGSYLVRRFAGADLPVQLNPALIPYSDHFPFVAAGVPSAWIGRDNCASGRFFHHRPDDDMTRVSCPLVARVVSATGTAIAKLAAVEHLPFSTEIPAGMRAGAITMWKELFGGWAGFGTR